MNWWRVAFVVLIPMACAACASTPVASPQPKFALTVSNEPAAKRFLVSLRSLEQHQQVCLNVRHWPKAGNIFAPHAASVVTVAGTFEADFVDMGYCPGGCGEIRLGPLQTISGELSYSAFPEESRLAAEQGHAQLSLDIHPTFCTE